MIGEEGGGGTECSHSSSGGDRRRGDSRYKPVGMGGNTLFLGISSMYDLVGR